MRGTSQSLDTSLNSRFESGKGPFDVFMGYAGTLGCQASKLRDAGQPRAFRKASLNVSQRPAKFARAPVEGRDVARRVRLPYARECIGALQLAGLAVLVNVEQRP